MPSYRIPRLTKEQAAIIGAYTGIAVGPFEDIQEYAEKILGHPIFTHEFASKRLCEELKRETKPDLLSLCYDPEESK